MLKTENLNTYYGNIHALKGINLEVNKGEIVALIGSNGAGKSTTLNTISGLIKPKSGKVIFDNQDITSLPAHEILKKGISLSPEGREVFPALSVEENLRLGAFCIKSKAEVSQLYEMVYELFPRLKERERQTAGTLSGGEQQMLAIARSLMSKPRVLMLDEPSLGLAPNLVMLIFELIVDINKQGITVLLIEQNANMALSVADCAYVLEVGEISMEGKAKDLANDPRVKKAYLGQL